MSDHIPPAGELPALRPSDHPDFVGGWVWTEMEIRAIQAYARQAIAAAEPEQQVGMLSDADALDAQELRFYRAYGFPYVDWEHAFDEPRVGMYAIKLPLGWPHPDGEGTCAATILHAFTVEQLYAKACRHIESLGPNPGGAASLEPGKAQDSGVHPVGAPASPLPLGAPVGAASALRAGSGMCNWPRCDCSHGPCLPADRPAR